MITVVTILHVAAAAAWFGHKLLIPREVRISVREGAGEFSRALQLEGLLWIVALSAMLV